MGKSSFSTLVDVAGRLLVAVLLLFAVVAQAEAAKKKKPPAPDASMRFAVVRGDSASCRPDCPEWIWAEGEIRTDTASRFKKFLKTVGKRKLPVIVQSKGGSLQAAFEMGRMIRARGLDVAVGYTTFTSCAPRQEGCKAETEGGYRGIVASGFAYCWSACPMIVAAGTRRVVGSWAHLGVHQVTTTMVREKVLYRTTTTVVKGKKVVKKKIVSRKDAGSYTTTKMNKSLRRTIEAYLNEMGVSTNVIELMNKTPASEILRLDQHEMLEMKLITSLDQVELLAGTNVCKTAPRPDNCMSLAEIASAAAARDGAPVPTFREAAMSAHADEMRFEIVRASGAACHPDCPEWVFAQGTIGPRSAAELRRILSATTGRRLPVVIDSGGGDVRGALALGRLIRERGLDVAVARTKIVPCPLAEAACPQDFNGAVGTTTNVYGGDCVAACSLVLAAGKRRIVHIYARVSLANTAFQSEVQQYLREMGTDDEMYKRMRGMTFGSGEDLPKDYMRKVGLTTDSGSAYEFTSPGICKQSARPENCRVTGAAS